MRQKSVRVALAGQSQPKSLVSSSGLYVAAISALCVLSALTIERALRTAVSVLPEPPGESSRNRVEKVAHDSSTSLRRVSELKKLDNNITPISFQTAADETRAPPVALLPDPHPADIAYRLSIFLGGDSEQLGSTPETSAPAVAGYRAECKTECEASVAFEHRADETSIEVAEVEPAHDESRPGLLDVAEATESEGLADLKPAVIDLDAPLLESVVLEEVGDKSLDLRKAKKPAKKYAKAVGRNAVAERPKKSLVSAGFSALGMAPQPAEPKSSKVQLTQVDLFTSYLIGSR